MAKLKNKTAYRLMTTLIGTALGSRLYREYKSRQIRSRCYRAQNEEGIFPSGVIVMSDGKIFQGGLCDRLWGMITTWDLCSRNGIPCRFFFTEPFDLSLFLTPNQEEWRIDSKSVSISGSIARPLYYPYSGSLDDAHYLRIIRKALDGRKQVHVYTNVKCADDRFHDCFHRLFKPSEFLEEKIQAMQTAIGTMRYISVSFRFMNLLGDFDDIENNEISQERKAQAIKECLWIIDYLKSVHPEIDRVAVTADSEMFLALAKQKSYVFVVEGGGIQHLGLVDPQNAVSTQLKTFLDLYLVAGARKAYLAWLPGMYKNSFFAYTAALMGNIPFERIGIRDVLQK